MEEQVKNIISKYTKIPAEQINASTAIDRSAVASSIILHRMYAQLASEGFTAANYADIKNYGQLLAVLNQTGATVIPVVTDIPSYSISKEEQETAIGIDIELISAMPLVNDFRESEFYKMNFAPAEIAYCILQKDPYASFTGLFAAKEALIKADNGLQIKNFNTIVIDHLPMGKPVFPGFQLSISHTGETVVAVAIKNIFFSAPVQQAPLAANTGNSSLISLISFSAFLLSLLALVLLLLQRC
jgi:phosphopantetheine--protein transferase-like protein